MGEISASPQVTLSTAVIPLEFVSLDPDLRFIKVKKSQKVPLETGWQTTSNYNATDPGLIEWIRSGGNWGYFPRDGSDLCVLDADKPDELADLIDYLGDTLTIKSGRNGTGYHILFRCPDLGTQKIYLRNSNGIDIGDIRPGGTERKYQTVGPGSIHPDTGQPYVIVNSCNPVDVDKEELYEVIKKYLVQTEKKKTGRRKVETGAIDNYLTQQAGILFNQGLRESDLFNALSAINREDCSPPSEDSNLHRICASAMRNFAFKPDAAGCKKPDLERYELTHISLTRTDLGNAERFKRKYGDVVRYCPTLKSWFIWNGRVWEQDQTNRREILAINTVRSIYGEAERKDDDDERKKLASWAAASESQSRRVAMLQTVSSMVATHHDLLDAKPDLFNLQNGTYNLKTHEFREHRQEDLLTKIAGIRYDPQAKSPTWMNHLNLIFSGDEELISGFQELCGYSLLSGNPAEIFVVAWGSGRNGKGKTFDAITHVFGDYSGNTSFSTFVVSKYSGGRGSASPELIDLIGTRFVRASESEEGARLAESLIKSLTGGDLISARGLYQGFITFKPEFTIFLQTNHKPVIRNWDQAIEARLWLVPFDKFIEPAQRDYHILDKLIAEGSGIFNWMLEGLKQYQLKGRLIQPKAVKEATDEYKKEQDRLGEFVESLCVKGKNESCYRKDLYTAYNNDCLKNGVEPVSQNSFSRLLQSHHGVQEGKRKENGRTWNGIRLKLETDTSDTFPHNSFKSNTATENRKNVSEVSPGQETPSLRLETPQFEAIDPDTLSDPDTFSYKNSTRGNIVQSYGKNSQKVSCVRNLEDWITRYKFPANFPVSEYIPMPLEKRKGSICVCHPCDDKDHPLYWVPGRYHQICQHHFNELQDILKKEREGIQEKSEGALS